MISVVIPTYEMYGDGENFLRISLDQLKKQSINDFEVIISDHSKDDVIKNCVKNYDNDLNINYISYNKNYGNSSANLNNGLRQAKGDIIKILMQDEFILQDGLKKINDFFISNKNSYWVLSGCLYGNSLNNIKGNMTPNYNENVKFGINTVGSPSVLSFRNEKIEFFDENLIWLMDCEYYYRLEKKFGLPNFIKDYIVFITQHKNQLTMKLSQEIKENENKYVNEKYNSERN
jgi:glycosyltransferase involved in cell wall biosynthesis